jgi:hypothetical protein
VTARAPLEDLRTRIANQAASLAEAVTDGFEDFHIGAGDYVVDLSVPEGPSTGGGALARQNLRLAPRRQGYALVVAGIVDPVSNTAELRTFEHVALLHELRYRQPLEITPDEYQSFLGKAQVVLNLARIRAVLVPVPPDLLAQRTAKQKLSVPMLAVFLMVMLLAAFVVFRIATVVRAGGH